MLTPTQIAARGASYCARPLCRAAERQSPPRRCFARACRRHGGVRCLRTSESRDAAAAAAAAARPWRVSQGALARSPRPDTRHKVITDHGV
ncbi:unnamed protein product [Merluccius merluccius]